MVAAALHAPRTATLQSSAAPRLAPLRAYGKRRSDEDRFGDDEDWEMEGSGIEYKVDRFGKATPSPFTVGEGYDLKDVLETTRRVALWQPKVQNASPTRPSTYLQRKFNIIMKNLYRPSSLA